MVPPASSAAGPSPKQLVFLFMAATVVAVVVFLCGVLVGRGVPLRQVAEGGSSGAGQVTSLSAGLDPAVLDPVSSEPSAAASATDDLTYYSRLAADGPVDEPLNGVDVPPLAGGVSTHRPGTAPSVAARAAPPLVAEPAAAASVQEFHRSVAVPNEPVPESSLTTGYAYTVQVAALRAPDTAEQVAGRLIAKGFPAYVVDPAPDTPVGVYRVRVGQYRERGEAEQVRRRLETEEHFKPWIIR